MLRTKCLLEECEKNRDNDGCFKAFAKANKEDCGYCQSRCAVSVAAGPCHVKVYVGMYDLGNTYQAQQIRSAASWNFSMLSLSN